MPFTLKETIGGLNHLRFRWQRKLFNQPVDLYLGPAAQEQLVRPAMLPDGRMEVCWICGFALARLTLQNEWTLETCSATGLKHVLRNKGLDEWSKTLGKSVSSVGSLPGTNV